LFDKITVVWSVREQVELLSYNSFLQEQDIVYIPTVTQDPEWPGESNRITTQLTTGLIDTNPIKNKIMICGSLSFNNDVKDILNGWGWSEGNRRTAGTFVQEKAFVS